MPQTQISTGSTKLDQAFGGGGIVTGIVTYIVSNSSAGKTQLTHTLAVTCQVDIDYNLFLY